MPRMTSMSAICAANDSWHGWCSVRLYAIATSRAWWSFGFTQCLDFHSRMVDGWLCGTCSSSHMNCEGMSCTDISDSRTLFPSSNACVSSLLSLSWSHSPSSLYRPILAILIRIVGISSYTNKQYLFLAGLVINDLLTSYLLLGHHPDGQIAHVDVCWFQEASQHVAQESSDVALWLGAFVGFAALLLVCTFISDLSQSLVNVLHICWLQLATKVGLGVAVLFCWTWITSWPCLLLYRHE